MAQFEFTIVETVKHQHSLIIECEDLTDALLIADCMEDEEMDHPDDITTVAKNCGANIVEFNRDYMTYVDEIEIEDVEEAKED